MKLVAGIIVAVAAVGVLTTGVFEGKSQEPQEKEYRAIAPLVVRNPEATPANTPTATPTSVVTATPTSPPTATATSSPTPTRTPTPAPGGPWYTSAHHSAEFYYCAADQGWKGITPSNLREYATEAELLAVWGGERLKHPDSKC